MEIGNQIKALRLRRGVTQEALAERLKVSPQAVSKWERAAATPDIQLLPEISAFFGVSIDELFALTDETRMDRIENMLWDQRDISPSDLESSRAFLLDKARREPENGEPYELLAVLENHAARSHYSMAEEYAKEALRRKPDLRGAHSALVEAMRGLCPDWNYENHCELIEWYKEFLEKNPKCLRGYMWLLDQLLDDYRFDEAERYCGLMEQNCAPSSRIPLYRGIIAWHRGEREKAHSIWAGMEMEPGEEWLKEANLGDFMARAGEWEAAKEHYRQAMAIQACPRYTDAPRSIAQICEIQGDYAGAVAALEQEIAILGSDWGRTTGESVAQVRRMIDRLREKQQKTEQK